MKNKVMNIISLIWIILAEGLLVFLLIFKLENEATRTIGTLGGVIFIMYCFLKAYLEMKKDNEK